MQAEEDQVMEDDCLLYKCSFYEKELSVVFAVLAVVVRGQVEMK